MTKIFILIFRDLPQKYCYTSIEALCTDYGHEELGVGKDRLTKVLREKGFFKNSYIQVEKLMAYTKSEILTRKQKKI